jgi:ATP-binding cassette subfamily B protein/subfamily B ATP-binding cassette protein MsbA
MSQPPINLTAPLPLPLQWLIRRWGEDRQWPARMVWNLVKRHRRLMGGAFLATCLAGFCEGSSMAVFVLAIGVLMGSSGSGGLAGTIGPVGKVLEPFTAALGKDELFLVLVMLAIGLQFLRSLSQFGNTVILARLNVQTELDVAGAIFQQYLRLAYGQISRYKAGELTSYSVQARAPGYLIAGLNDLAVQLMIATALAGVLLLLSWQMALGVLVVLFLLSRPIRRIQRALRGAARDREQKLAALTDCTVEYLQGIRLLNCFNLQGYAAQFHGRILAEEARANGKVTILQGLIIPLLECLAVVGIATLLLGSHLLFRDRQQEVLAYLLGFLFVLYRLMPRVNAVHHYFAAVNNLLPVTHRIANFLRDDDKRLAPRGGRPVGQLTSGIEFRKVSFRYPGTERDALAEVSFTIPRGSMVALVGESGAGKSTISDLLLRLYDPTAGQILIDGVDLRDLDPQQWRAAIGVVSQDSFFFHTTVRENIQLGRLDAPDEAIAQAAAIAGANRFIADLPKGADTVVGDRGLRLSGGQRQQLAIARAILRDPQLLLLDEATSSLDNQSERLIQQAVEKVGGNRTILAIAHRLSTIVMADRIIVLERGRIVESGTHHELLAMNGTYARLWRLQAEGAERSVPVDQGEKAA